MSTFPFGKYSGKEVITIWENDSPYCVWFLQSVNGRGEAIEKAKAEIRQLYLQEGRLERAEYAHQRGVLAAHDMISLSEGGVMSPKQGERYMILLAAAIEAGIVQIDEE